MSRPRFYKLLALSAITLLAAFLRLYRIDSLPPSDGYDQATYGLDVLAILDGARPVFLPSNFGREALYSYLVTLCYLLIGDGGTAVYVTSAIAGVLAVPATFIAAEELFRDEKGALRRYGSLLAAFAMAISYWHLNWSRLGMRAILVPLLAALTIFWLWRALRTGERWMFATCGLFLGLSIHAYQAARALPILVLLGFAYVFWHRRSLSGSDLLNVALVALVALAVFAPLGAYFLTHPGSSGVRIGQTLVVDSSADTRSNLQVLLDQVTKTLLTFSIRGDTDARVTIPGRPALDPYLSLAFLAGIVVSLLRIRRSPYLLLLTWLAGLSAPAVLAELGAVTKRAIGATPAVAMLVAIGCLVTWEQVHRWAIWRQPSWANGLSAGLGLLIAAGFAYSGVRTYRDYFVVWSSDPDLFTHFETGQSAIGRYIKDRPPEERIYLSPVPADHHSVVLNSERRTGVKGYQGRFCIVVPARAAQDTTYIIVPADDKHSLPLLRSYLPQGEVIDEGPLHYQLPYFLAYHVPAGATATVSPMNALAANWGNKVKLLGFDLDASAPSPGDQVRLTVYYQGLDSMDVDYTVFVQLLGPENPATGGPLWAQDDSEPCRRGYPTSSWEKGEIVVDHFQLSIPTTVPSGTYEVAMGFYDWHTMERLPVLDPSGAAVGDHVTLMELQLAGRE